jgi:hypothetical protein
LNLNLGSFGNFLRADCGCFPVSALVGWIIDFEFRFWCGLLLVAGFRRRDVWAAGLEGQGGEVVHYLVVNVPGNTESVYARLSI